MEKRFREYLKHFEKLDYDVLSEEEINDEKGNLELKTGLLHRELVRLLMIIMGLLICASIFLSTALSCGNILCYVLAAVSALFAAYISISYRGINGIIRQLEGYIDKLTML
ncbi:MAG: hypothetical protein K6E70_04500 [Butyrivibrio sp.]|jgi:hypothetical protein|nr:hypothetical protein [Butyrivibrio sp.]